MADVCVMPSEREAQKHEERERQRLEDMSEDEYDALTDGEKAEVDRKRLEIKKERLRRYVWPVYRVKWAGAAGGF